MSERPAQLLSALRGGMMLFPALVMLMGLSVAVAAIQGAIREADHWMPEFGTTWRYLMRMSK